MVKPAQFSGPSHVEVFAETAGGDSQPLRTFTDAGSAMQNAEGMALTTTSPGAVLPETRLGIVLPLLAGSLLAGSVAITRRRRRQHCLA
jgi:hypothetical protein